MHVVKCVVYHRPNHVVLMFLTILTTSQTSGQPIDKDATPETRTLFYRLQELAKNPDQIIFGQQRATQDGIYGWKPPYGKQEGGGWAYTAAMGRRHKEDELCDIKSVTGDYPGIIGFNLADLGTFALEVIMELTKRAHARGSVITFYMLMNNPATGGSHHIKQDGGPFFRSVRRILPGGDKHRKFLSILDNLAEFVLSLKDDKSRAIPVLFRPFHEGNGWWFWYGQNKIIDNTPEDFVNMWRFTVEYLRDIKQVHNFLYVYAPSDQYVDLHTNGNALAFLATYPGDAYVDVFAFDGYHNVMEDARVPVFLAHVRELVIEAEKRGKIPAIGEIGLLNNGIEKNHNFWSGRILSSIKKNPVTRRVAYILTWTNRCAPQACVTWVPFKGHPAQDDFVRFYKDNVTVFSSNMPNLYT